MPKHKNPGPPLVSRKAGALDVVSPEWRAKLGLTVTQQKQNEDAVVAALSATVVESRLDTDQTNETNKVNTELGSPTGVTINEKVLVDGVAATRAKTIVAENTALPAISYLTVDSKQRAWGTGYSEQEVTTVPSWPSRQGQEFDPLFEFTASYTKQIAPLGTGVGSAGVDSRPIDHKSAEVTTYNAPSGITSKVITTQQLISLDVPDELVSLTTIWEASHAAGAYTQIGEGAAAGATAQLQLSPQGRASGSAVAMPDLIPEDIVFNQSVTCPVYTFFMATPVSEAALASRLTTIHGSTVNMWPNFRPQRIRVVLKGKKVAVEANTDLAISVSIFESTQSYAYSEGEGGGVDVGTVLRVITLGPYIHDNLTILGDLTKTEGVTVVSETENDAGTNWPGGSASATASASATGEVEGFQLTATSPATVPRTGYYARVLGSESWKFGYTIFKVAVVDMSKL